MRSLLASADPDAQLAIDLFVFRIAKETAALAATLGALDGFVFTAGIGENAPVIRQKVAERLGWLGLELDAKANIDGPGMISAPASRVKAWVIPTDEEAMIARHTRETVAQR
jgi:acetate kinase